MSRVVNTNQLRMLAQLLNYAGNTGFVQDSLNYMADWSDEIVDATPEGPKFRDTGEDYPFKRKDWSC